MKKVENRKERKMRTIQEVQLSNNVVSRIREQRK